MLQLLLNLSNQLFPLLINGILGSEEFAPLDITAALQLAQLLLASQLVLKGLGKGGGAANFPNLLVQFLDLLFARQLEVLAPTIELEDFLIEKRALRLSIPLKRAAASVLRWSAKIV